MLPYRLLLCGLSVHNLGGQPLDISLAIFDFSVVRVGLVVGVVGVQRILSVSDMVDSVG